MSCPPPQSETQRQSQSYTPSNGRAGAGPTQKSQSRPSGTVAPGRPRNPLERVLCPPGSPTSTRTTLPMRPFFTSSTARRISPLDRCQLPVCHTRPLRSTARTRARPSRRSCVNGFSPKMSLPQFAANTPMGACQWSGVAMSTASMSSRRHSSRKSRYVAQSLLP